MKREIAESVRDDLVAAGALCHVDKISHSNYNVTMGRGWFFITITRRPLKDEFNWIVFMARNATRLNLL